MKRKALIRLENISGTVESVEVKDKGLIVTYDEPAKDGDIIVIESRTVGKFIFIY